MLSVPLARHSSEEDVPPFYVLLISMTESSHQAAASKIKPNARKMKPDAGKIKAYVSML